MILFKSHDDLKKLDSNNPAYPLIKSLLKQTINNTYSPAEDGYIILIEKEDREDSLNIFQPPIKLAQIKWEGVTYMDDFFHAVYLPNNQFTLSFLIPNNNWLSPALRKTLEEHL